MAEKYIYTRIITVYVKTILNYFLFENWKGENNNSEFIIPKKMRKKICPSKFHLPLHLLCYEPVVIILIGYAFWSNLLVIKKTEKTKRLLFNRLFIFLISATYIFILPSLNGLLIPLSAPEHNSTIFDNSLFFVLLVFWLKNLF